MNWFLYSQLVSLFSGMIINLPFNCDAPWTCGRLVHPWFKITEFLARRSKDLPGRNEAGSNTVANGKMLLLNLQYGDLLWFTTWFITIYD